MQTRKDKISKEFVSELLGKINFEMLEDYKDQATPLKVKCNACGDVVHTRIVNIKQGGKPRCSCSNYAKYNKDEAEKLLLERNLKPLEEYVGNTDKPWRMVCLNCNNEITPTFKNIKKGQGCRYCNHGTKKYDETVARVYLLHHKRGKVLKIGLASQSGSRLKAYNRDWKLIKYVELTAGKLAFKLEKEVLKKWRVDLGLSIAIGSDSDLLDKVAGGYTETADESGKDDALAVINDWVRGGLAKELEVD